MEEVGRPPQQHPEGRRGEDVDACVARRRGQRQLQGREHHGGADRAGRQPRRRGEEPDDGDGRRIAQEMAAVQQREDSQQQIDVEENHPHVKPRYGQHVCRSRAGVGRTPLGCQLRLVACGHRQRDGLRVGREMEPSDAFRRRFVEAVHAGGAVGRLGSQRGQRHAEQQQGDGDVAVADAPSIRYEGHECRCGEGCGQKTGRQGRVAGDGHSRRREEQYPRHRVRPRGLPERTALAVRRMQRRVSHTANIA